MDPDFDPPRLPVPLPRVFRAHPWRIASLTIVTDPIAASGWGMGWRDSRFPWSADPVDPGEGLAGRRWAISRAVSEFVVVGALPPAPEDLVSALAGLFESGAHVSCPPWDGLRVLEGVTAVVAGDWSAGPAWVLARRYVAQWWMAGLEDAGARTGRERILERAVMFAPRILVLGDGMLWSERERTELIGDHSGGSAAP